ncbi:two-partner secretion domain-containing protein [Nostoc sp.]
MTQPKIPITTITIQTNLDSTIAVSVGMGIAIAFWANCAFAQITPDGTLGDRSSRITPNVNIKGSAGDRIDGGAIRGANLFHSFQEFNVGELQRVYFANPTGISNILTRVTGRNVSNILGTLGVDGSANLFFLNPNGIIFGQNARLDVSGSFVATTANSFVFGDRLEFSAANPQTPSALLTVNPSALFFNQLQAGRIENRSIAPAGIDPSGLKASGLRVADGKSLLLVGGNVSMDGGKLNAYGGRVEFGGLAAPGNVNLVFNRDNLSLKFPLNVTRADISLTNQAGVYVEGAGGGDIAVNARNVDILGGSVLSAGIGHGLGTPETVAGDITVNGTGEIKVAGSGGGIGNFVRLGSKGNGGNITIDSGDFSLQDDAELDASTLGQGNAGNVTVSAKNAVSLADAGIFSTVQAGGVGKGGNIDINATSLSLTDGAQLQTRTDAASATQPAGRGDAGNVNVKVTGAVDISGEKNGFASGILSYVDTGTVGNGGNIFIDSGDFSLRDDAELDTSTVGQGNAGNVTVSAKNAVSLAGNSNIFSTVDAGGVGKGGNIDINAANLSLTDDAQLETITSAASATQPAGRGDAGNVNVKVTGAVDISGEKNGFASGIFSYVDTGTVGNGGNIFIDSGDLSLRDGAQLQASTSGQGNAGNVTVSAKNAVSLAGQPTAILSTVEAGGVGKGGNIDINAATLSLTDGAQLETITRAASASKRAGRGDAGNVNVKVTGAVDIAGEINGFPSGIRSLVETGTVGNGGNIFIDSGDFSLQDGAQLSASTFGQGNAGNVTVGAKDAVTVSGTNQETGFSSALLTYTNSTSTGKGGDITVNTNIFRVSDGALLDADTANNQKGGDITVNANIFEALNGGQLTTATSSNGGAGKITVNATDTVIISGIDPSYSDYITKFSDNVLNIGANSGLFVSSTGSGITGDIEVNSPQITLDNQGELNASSASGNGGNINVNSDLLLLRHGAEISTNAGTSEKGGDGGNITINIPSGFIVAVPDENSNITANAFKGSGGKVTINAHGIFGMTVLSREDLVRLLGTNDLAKLDVQQLPSSITAISQTSPTLNGQVTINTPDVDPSRGLIQLPSKVVDASQQITQGCTSRRGKNTSHFIATGRGGLPLSPNEPLRGRAVIIGWVDLPPQATPRVTDKISTTSVTKSTNQIVEAQGWIVDANGDIILVAQSGQSSFIPSAMSCNQ